MSDHWKDLADKLGTPSFDLIPKKSRTSRANPVAPNSVSSSSKDTEPETASAAISPEAVTPAPKQEEAPVAPPKKRSSSWDALSRLFGMGGAATEEVVESPSNPPETTSTARPEPATKVSKERDRSAIDEPARSKNTVVDASDEIGWVSPKSQKASRAESSRPDSSPKEVANREPTSRESVGQRESSTRDSSRDPAAAPRGGSEGRRSQSERRDSGRRDSARSDKSETRTPSARNTPSQTNALKSRSRDEAKSELDDRPTKRRPPSFWDNSAELEVSPDVVEEILDEPEVAEAPAAKDFEEAECDGGETPMRRGRRRRPRRGRRDGESAEIERSASPRAEEPRRRSESPRSEGGRSESPRGEPSRSESRCESGRTEFARNESSRDNARRERLPSNLDAEAPVRGPESEDSEGDGSSRSGGRRRSRGRRGRGADRVGSDRPGASDRVGAGDRPPRELDRARDDMSIDDVEEVDSELPPSVFEEETPVEPRGRGRDRNRGRNRPKPPRDEAVERTASDDDESIDLHDDEDGDTQARHRKIPTWAEAIGILVELNQENHKKASSQFGGHRRRGGHSNDSHRGGGGGHRGHQGQRGGGNR